MIAIRTAIANTARARDEPYDNPKEHLVIERAGSPEVCQPTPELYALAREQWYRLPGVVLRPSMDPVVGDLAYR